MRGNDDKATRDTVSHCMVGDALVVLLGSQPAGDDDWHGVCDAARSLWRDAGRYPHARVLALSDGGLPTPEQLVEAERRMREHHIEPRSIPVAVISPAAGRPSLPAMQQWVNVRLFHPADSQQALEWLQIDLPRAKALAQLLPDLARRVGGSTSATAVLAQLCALIDRASPAERVALERTKLARELEESLGPQLAELRRGLAGFALRTTGGARSEFDRLSSRVEQARDELEGIVWAMEAKERSWQDVASYVRKRVAELDGAGPVCRCSYSGPDQARVPGATALHVLRIVQEGLRNALRHAAAQRIEISLTCDERQVIVRIADDGCGIADDKLDAPHGGLEHIRTRARVSGGSAHVVSSADGTCWTVTLPLRVGPASKPA